MIAAPNNAAPANAGDANAGDARCHRRMSHLRSDFDHRIRLWLFIWSPRCSGVFVRIRFDFEIASFCENLATVGERLEFQGIS